MTARKPAAGIKGDHPEKTAAGQAEKAQAEQADAASKQVQEAVERDTAQGFRGVEADPTPNDHYTVAGVVDGKPVPETDDEAAKAARERLTALGQDPRA
jgi:hypothetical protein